jgi:hypothetical protein
MFGASVMGAGIMLTVVFAIARIIYGKQVIFERTPKYGISRASDSWDGKRYTLGVDPLLALELLLACFSFGTMAYAAAIRSWGSCLYIGYLLTGLLFVIGVSFYQLSAPILPRALATSSGPGNHES